MRTRTSKTFETKAGRRVARLYGASVHFRDSRGRWRNIDGRLLRSGGRLLNRANRFHTSLPQDLSSDTVRVRLGERSVALKLRGARGVARVRGNRATYANALPGVDVVYSTLADSLKEELVLRDDSAQRRLSFDLTPSRGLRPDVLASQAVVLRDRLGRPRLALPAPFMVDADGASERVGVRLRKTAGAWRLSYELDHRWLNSRKRAWPVVVDPGVQPTADRDCYLDESLPDSSYCAATQMKVGQVGEHDHNVIMRFPLDAVPRGAEVSGATLVAYMSQKQTSTWTKVTAEPLTQEWSSAATWNRNDGTGRWSEPGGESDPAAAAEYPAYFGGEGDGENYWTMLRMVRDWVSGKRPNHGLVLRSTFAISGGGER